jgi:hypothetical protein
MAYGLWLMANDSWFTVYGLWFIASWGCWSMSVWIYDVWFTDLRFMISDLRIYGL